VLPLTDAEALLLPAVTVEVLPLTDLDPDVDTDPEALWLGHRTVEVEPLLEALVLTLGALLVEAEPLLNFDPETLPLFDAEPEMEPLNAGAFEVDTELLLELLKETEPLTLGAFEVEIDLLPLVEPDPLALVNCDVDPDPLTLTEDANSPLVDPDTETEPENTAEADADEAEMGNQYDVLPELLNEALTEPLEDANQLDDALTEEDCDEAGSGFWLVAAASGAPGRGSSRNTVQSFTLRLEPKKWVTKLCDRRT
jgi:hypothetical protein